MELDRVGPELSKSDVGIICDLSRLNKSAPMCVVAVLGHILEPGGLPSIQVKLGDQGATGP